MRPLQMTLMCYAGEVNGVSCDLFGKAKIPIDGEPKQEYTIDDYGNGSVKQNCKVYVSKYGHFESKHWEGALRDLEMAMDMNAKNIPVISEDLPLSKKPEDKKAAAKKD